MKITSRPLFVKKAYLGFTLIELLIVISIIALLAALTIGGFSYAQVASSRNRTIAAHAAIKSGLEQYKDKFGEYPDIASSQKTTIAGKDYEIGGALMLYQAITGNGSDMIKDIKDSTASKDPSTMSADDLKVIAANAMNSALPKQMILKTANGYMLVDGFGRPFQYQKGDAPGVPTPTTINPTYDLWSFGNAETITTETQLTMKQDAKTTASWIKNW